MQASTLQERFDYFKETVSPACGFGPKEFVALCDMCYFIAPAGVSRHGVYTGGCFDHSRAVTEFLLRQTMLGVIKWENPRSPFVVGMFHDLCKCDDYIMIGDVWQWDVTRTLMGHGDKSVMMLSQIMTLTDEEILCIRYHLGAYETEAWEFFDKAIKKYETVLWTHTADMYAAKVLQV